MAGNKHGKRMDLAAARRAIEAVARRENRSFEQVRAEMIEAMREGWENPDPRIRAKWKQIPCAGEMPTPEELIVWINSQEGAGFGFPM